MSKPCKSGPCPRCLPNAREDAASSGGACDVSGKTPDKDGPGAGTARFGLVVGFECFLPCEASYKSLSCETSPRPPNNHTRSRCDSHFSDEEHEALKSYQASWQGAKCLGQRGAARGSAAQLSSRARSGRRARAPHLPASVRTGLGSLSGGSDSHPPALMAPESFPPRLPRRIPGEKKNPFPSEATNLFADRVLSYCRPWASATL